MRGKNPSEVCQHPLVVIFKIMQKTARMNSQRLRHILNFITLSITGFYYMARPFFHIYRVQFIIMCRQTTLKVMEQYS